MCRQMMSNRKARSRSVTQETDGSAPEREDVKKQLDVIVNSKTFSNHPKLIELLRQLVDSFLAGTTMDEDQLGRKLFGRPDTWLPSRESAVRERKRLLRKTLSEYYATEGQQDKVLLILPKHGTLQTILNPDFGAAIAVSEALKMMDRTLPEVINRYSCKVTADLQRCIEQYPDYAPAYTALSEALLIYTACDHWDSFPAGQSMTRAEQAAQRAVTLDPNLSRGHIILGAVHCCRFRWKDADKSFKTAMEIDPYETITSWFYVIFLRIVGRFRELRRISGLIEKDRNGNLLRAFLVYLEDPDSPYSSGKYLALRECAIDDASLELDEKYRAGERLLRFDSWQASCIAACICLQRGWTELAARYADRGMMDSGVGAFLGLSVLTCSLHGKTNEVFSHIAAEYFKQCKDVNEVHAFGLPNDPKPTSTFSRAIAYLGMGMPSRAVDMLSDSADEGFPLMTIVSVCPLFNELRDRPDFMELMERMNIP
jgi:hypothetical protein